MARKFSRREFLIGAGAAGVGLAATAAIPVWAQTSPSGASRAINLTSDLGVPADGSDVSTQFAAALSRVPPGSTVVFQPKGRYGISSVRLENLAGLVLVGQGAIIARLPVRDRRARPFELFDCRSITIEGLEIAGTETDWRYSEAVEFQPGIAIRGGEGFVLRDLHIHNVGGDGISIHATRNGVARSILIERVRVEYARRQGITLAQCDRVVVQDCSIAWVGRSGFDAEPYAESWSASRITIQRCRVTHLNNYVLAAGGAGRHDGLVFQNNEGIGGIGFALIATRRSPPATGVVIENNRYTWDDPEYRQRRSLSDFQIYASDAVAVTGNQMEFNSGSAVEIHAPAGVVRNNAFKGVNEGLVLGRGIQASDNVVTTRKGDPAPIRVAGS
jgi:hypothetical protein